MRLDKFLQVSRLVKRRTLANELCDSGRVRVNGQKAKATANVKTGDVITIAQGDRR
ncbi:MAG TPA: S4 domain-containing protein, partial [bacterium]|nr:S4 domain-containing protein [bacterium]